MSRKEKKEPLKNKKEGVPLAKATTEHNHEKINKFEKTNKKKKRTEHTMHTTMRR